MLNTIGTIKQQTALGITRVNAMVIADLGDRVMIITQDEGIVKILMKATIKVTA